MPESPQNAAANAESVTNTFSSTASAYLRRIVQPYTRIRNPASPAGARTADDVDHQEVQGARHEERQNPVEEACHPAMLLSRSRDAVPAPRPSNGPRPRRGRLAQALAKPLVVEAPLEGLHPFLFASRVKAGHSVLDHFPVRADRAHDCGHADAEVLDRLHRALAGGPGVIGERHDPHVERPEVLDLGLALQGRHSTSTPGMREIVDADDAQAEAPPTGQRLKRSLDEPQVLDRAVAPRPADHRNAACGTRRRGAVLAQRDRRRNDRHVADCIAAHTGRGARFPPSRPPRGGRACGSCPAP